jgi:succinyl-diaminopimelate desuccinylase
VYTEQTGEEATLLSIGGGTYARSLKAGVAFGPLFPGRPDIAHQKDEYIEIEDLVKATAIYAQAIYELIK